LDFAKPPTKVTLGIATGYGLETLSSIPGRGKKIFAFSTAFRPAVELTQPHIQCELGTFPPGGKEAGV
jgi:hypothetical protein